MVHKMLLQELPASRPEIWRIAIFLQGMFSKEAWAVADKAGWYRAALKVHNEVFRQQSPYLAHEIPMEARVFTFNNEQE